MCGGAAAEAAESAVRRLLAPLILPPKDPLLANTMSFSVLTPLAVTSCGDRVRRLRYAGPVVEDGSALRASLLLACVLPVHERVL